MADYYSNPFGAYNTDFGGTAAGPGFVNQWQTMEQTAKNEMAKPFIERAGKMQELELQRKQQEQNEFMSQDAMMARVKELKYKITKYDADMERIPVELKRDIAKAKEDMRTYGPDADLKIAQAQDLAQQIKDKPIQKFIAAAADYGKVLRESKADPLTKAADYRRFIEDFKNANGNVTIPPNLENWSENTDRYLAGARLAALYSVAHTQEIEKVKMQTDASIEGHRISADATLGAARIAAQSRLDVLDQQDGTKQQRENTRVQEAINREYQYDSGLKAMEMEYFRARTKQEKADIMQRIDARKESIAGKVRSSIGAAYYDSKPTEEDGYVYTPGPGGRANQSNWKKK